MAQTALYPSDVTGRLGSILEIKVFPWVIGYQDTVTMGEVDLRFAPTWHHECEERRLGKIERRRYSA